MKLLLPLTIYLCISSISRASEAPSWKLPEIRDGVADLTDYDHKEFVAIKLLWWVQSGALPTKTNYQPLVTDEEINNARDYLLKKRFDYPGQDEFKRQRAAAKLDAMLTAGDAPFRSIADITHIRVDFREHMITTYNFEKSAFPFRPGNRGFTTHVSLYDASRPFKFETIQINDLPIEPELAERWKNDDGTLTALCRIGNGFAPRRGIPALRAVCEKIEFRTREGELLKEISLTPSQANIDKDYTIEEMMNLGDQSPKDPENPTVKEREEGKQPNRIPLIIVVLVVLAGIAWILLKAKSLRSKGDT